MISSKQWFALLVVYIFYLLIGASVFLHTERSHEIHNLMQLHKEQSRLTMVSNLIGNPEIKMEVQNSIRSLEEQLGKNLLLPQSFQKLIIRHINEIKFDNGTGFSYGYENDTDPIYGLDYATMENASDSLNALETFRKVFENYWEEKTTQDSVVEKEAMWTLWNSFFFSFTAITTIGFGHMSPKTTSGQMFCLVYSFLGVPFNGIVFAGLAELFSQKFVQKIDNERYKVKGRIVLDAVLFLIPGIIVFFILPAYVFMVVENWSFISSIYFTFITLSTIGFGDMVSGYVDLPDAWLWIYRLFIQAWIIFGLGYLLMIITFIQRALRSEHLRVIDRKMASLIKQKRAKSDANLSNELEKLGAILKTISNLRVGSKSYTIQESNDKSLLSSNNLESDESLGKDNPAFAATEPQDAKMENDKSQEKEPTADTDSVQIFLNIAKNILHDSELHSHDHHDGRRTSEPIDILKRSNSLCSNKDNGSIADNKTEHAAQSRRASLKRRISTWTVHNLSPKIGKMIDPEATPQAQTPPNEEDLVEDDGEIHNFGELIDKVEEILSHEVEEKKESSPIKKRQRSHSMFASVESHYKSFPNGSTPT